MIGTNQSGWKKVSRPQSTFPVMLNAFQEHNVSMTGKLSGPKGVHVS